MKAACTINYLNAKTVFCHAAGIIFFFFVLATAHPAHSQEKDACCNNRVSVGAGGENSILGVDYARNLYKQQLFAGLGFGGTGWTGYIRYEPFRWLWIHPFISSGISYTFGGTLVTSPGTAVFSASAGMGVLPGWHWRCLPMVSIGATYYSLLTGDTEGGLNGVGPLVKLGLAFPRKEK